jgi:hypothetical protein
MNRGSRQSWTNSSYQANWHSYRRRTPWAMTALVLLLIGASILAVGCASSPRHTPSGPSSNLAQLVPCGRPQTQPIVRGPVQAAAALLQANVVVVGERPSKPNCVVLQPGTTTRLRLTDRAEFVANGPPQVSPASTRAVAIATVPGPAGGGPGNPGGILIAHVIVTLTATQPGTASIQWIDCSGSGC